MKADDFEASLSATTPPPRLAAPLVALWWIARGDWDRAHELVQDEAGPEAAWVHAHLHRVQGDLGNAGYWYGRAGREPATGSTGSERKAIVAALLAA